MLKPKLWYFGHLMQKAYTLEKTLMLGKTEGRRKGGDRESDCWMASSTQWTWVWANSRKWWRTGKPGVLQSMWLQSQTQLSNWTTTSMLEKPLHHFLVWIYFYFPCVNSQRVRFWGHNVYLYQKWPNYFLEWLLLCFPTRNIWELQFLSVFVALSAVGAARSFFFFFIPLAVQLYLIWF